MGCLLSWISKLFCGKVLGSSEVLGETRCNFLPIKGLGNGFPAQYLYCSQIFFHQRSVGLYSWNIAVCVVINTIGVKHSSC